LEARHRNESQENVLQNARLLHGIPDIRSRDLNVTAGFPRIVEQDPVTDDVGFSLGEIAPATEANQSTAITCFGRNKQGEENANEKCDEALDCV
jgi:hypothetical protein